MDAPLVQYVKTSDGYNLAYFERGMGRPLLFVPSRLSSLTRTWSRFGAWIQPLADHYRLIHYDARGQGLSTRGLRPGASMADYVSDICRVLDHLSIDKAVLLSHGYGGHVVLHFAAAYPDRVNALILATVGIEVMKAWSSLWDRVAEENWDLFLRSLAPSYIGPDRIAAYVASLKECEAQTDFIIASDIGRASQLDDILPRITAPTLVIHPKKFVGVSPVEGPRLAGELPDARLSMIGGDEDDFLGAPDEFVGAIEAFLSGMPLARDDGPTAGLSSRELEVLRLLASGRSNKQIAEALVITRNTVAKHVTSILTKTESANRTEATSYAHRHRLI
jgi:pimeloyl-ACP methyl ester carboxylesterase/DNA-binding CsgD family transcriptional regulator